jgi:hypothetical protein
MGVAVKLETRTVAVFIGLAGLVASGHAAARPLAGPEAAARMVSVASLSQSTSRGSDTALTLAVADADCPHDRGIAVNTAEWTSRAAKVGNDYPQLAAAMLRNGDVLVVASGTPTPKTATAVEFRGPCAVDRRFGKDGATTLSLPGPGLAISTVVPAEHSRVLLAGSTDPANFLRQQWLVGELGAGGQPYRRFGTDGWSVLPWYGDTTSLAVTGTGAIIAGGEDRPKTNGESMVTKLTARGNLVRNFAQHGRVAMPGYHDGGIQGLWIEPDGRVLVMLSGGNMGCWGVSAVKLTPSGTRVASFTRRFLESLSRAVPASQCGTPVFVGGIRLGSGGFHLIGTSQRRCVYDGCSEHPTSKPDPSRALRDIAFTDTGALSTSFGTQGQTSIRAPMAEEAWTLDQPNGRVLLATVPTGNEYRKTRAYLRLTQLTRTGHLPAKHAVTRVALPFKTNDYSLPLDGAGAIPVSDGRRTEIVTNNSPGNSVTVLRPHRS